MIEVHVQNGKAELEQLRERHPISADSVVLAASEDGTAVGFVAFKLANGEMQLQHIDCTDNAVCELLLRAAFSYGERRGVRQVRSAFSEPESVLSRLGFRLIERQLTADVNNVVHMCRNCGEGGN